MSWWKKDNLSRPLFSPLQKTCFPDLQHSTYILHIVLYNIIGTILHKHADMYVKMFQIHMLQIRICVYILMYIFAYMCMWMCMHMYVDFCTCIYVHTQTHIYTYIYIYVYVHVHICTFKPFFAVPLHFHNENSISQCVKLLHLEKTDCCNWANLWGLIV